MSLPSLLFVLIVVACRVPHLQAQGLADGALTGVVNQPSGEPAADARVFLRNARTGASRQTQTNSSGRFLFENVPPGGPYRLEAIAIGLRPAPLQDSIMVGVGERISLVLAFASPAGATLPTLEIRAAPRADDGGPSFSIPSEMIRGLPLLSRNFVGLFATVPQAVGRTAYSISGQNPALNAIQIDGGISSDVYGVSPTPGAAAGAKSISLEALDQIRVLIAPVDVRQGAFTGGLINATTRSGTNRWETMIFSSLQRPQLVGRDTAGMRSHDFQLLQYGVTAGGPLVRDRLHLFVAADLQQSRTPLVGPEPNDPTTGISEVTARRAAAAFRNVYGFDAGGTAAPILDAPDRSLFTKLSWQPSTRHHLELSHNWVSAHSNLLNRTVRNRVNRDGWALSGSGSTVSALVRTSRLRLTSVVARATNEFLAGVQTTDEGRASSLRTPLFLVNGDVPGIYLAGGSVVNGQGTVLDQRLLELTDNVTIQIGAHDIVAGTHLETYRFTDNLFLRNWGVWTFSSVDSLEIRLPARYELAIPLRPGGPLAAFSAGQAAAYLQDRWSPTTRLTLTGGVRLDVPFTEAPATNATLAQDAALGRIDTGRMPSGKVQASPRLGVSWLARERGSVVLRVAIGSFAGRPPLSWLGGAFINTGLDQVSLICGAFDGVPPPTTDVDNLPQQCLGAPRGAVPPASVTFVDADFRYPQVVKTLAGIDADLGHGTSISVDLISTRSRYQTSVRDVNLERVGSSAEGRAMYGTVRIDGSTLPARRDQTTFTQVLALESHGGDRSTTVSATLVRRWRNGSQAQVGYQWSRARDAFTLNNPNATLAFQNAPVDGTIEDRRQGRSAFDTPHSLVASALAHLRYGVDASLLLRRQSGLPYAWSLSRDANGDGVQSNDLFYVPREASDISLKNPEQYPALEHFIASEPCLRDQRGRILARNSCRNPAVTTLDARLAKMLTIRSGQRMEISVDAFNGLNLLHGSWGLVRETTTREFLELLTVSGWDEANNRPVYTVPAPNGVAALPARNRVVLDASRWRIQLGARYTLR